MTLGRVYVFLFAAGCAFFIFSCGASSKPINHQDFMTVTVQEGETIDELASEYKHLSELDKSEMISWITTNNQINDVWSVQIGTELLLPVKKEREIRYLANK